MYTVATHRVLFLRRVSLINHPLEFPIGVSFASVLLVLVETFSWEINTNKGHDASQSRLRPEIGVRFSEQIKESGGPGPVAVWMQNTWLGAFWLCATS